ncbi:MAG: hypothetical protein IT569_09615 [Leptospiraceae bacterium]|nr:hypothetical protein [Leptospiraceae bacterium]
MITELREALLEINVSKDSALKQVEPVEKIIIDKTEKIFAFTEKLQISIFGYSIGLTIKFLFF